MIFTLTDRHYNVLDAYETDDYLIGQYIGSILETLEINVLVKSLNAEHWVEGNYIMCQDKKGKKRWFTIYDCEDSHGGDAKSLFCYSGTIDIVAEDAPQISASEAKPFKWYFDQIFYDTGIELGINEISDLTRKLEFTSENASNAEMLQYVLNGFDNAEASLDVEFDGSVPTKLVLNVYKRIGNEEPQAILSDEDDSLTSLDRKGSISDLATCLNPTGAEDENGNPITLVGKYYEEKDEQGNILYYSPVDSPRVFSVVARQNFYVQLPGKSNGEFDGYINRRYESQATTQDTLWQESLAQLKKIDHVAVTYEANGYIDCSIGDNVQIVSHEMKPPVMIAARTIEYKFNDDDPSRNVYKFGNYVELSSNLDELSKIIAEVKKQVEPQVVEAERNAKVYAETISVEKAAQAEENAKGYTDTVAGEAESNAKAYALSEADKARIAAIQAAATDAQTKVNAAKTALEASIAEKADAEWVNGQLINKADKASTYTKTEVDNALNGKVSTTTYTTDKAGIVNRLDNAESRITQTEKDITSKVSQTTFESALSGKENMVYKQNTAPAHANGRLWLDTSKTPNVLYRSNGSAWIKVTPTLAGEVGAFSQTDGTALAGRVSTAESTITQQADLISQKVSKTDYNGNTIASLINQTATTIKLQASKIELDGYVEAKHIKSLNGLNVGDGQFVVDANGNVKFAGNLEGASGTFGEVTVKDGDFYLKDTKSGIRYSLVKKTNILGDHSFELIKLSDPTSQDNIDHWWLPIITDNTNWETIGAPRGVPISIAGPGPADAMPIFGNFAVMVNSINYIEQPIWDLTSNTQYTFSVHAKRPYNNTPGAVRLEVHYKKYNTDGTSTRQLVAAQSFDTVASDYSVSRHALTFTSPNVARTGSDEIIFVIKGVNANWVHVDGVQVVKSAYPTVYDTEDSLWSFMNSRNGFKARAIWTEGIYNGVNGIDIDDNRIRIYSNDSLNYFSVENIESRFSTVPYDQWKDPEPKVKKAIKVTGGIATDGLYANTWSVNKNAIATSGKIYVGGEGIEIVWPGGTPYIDFTRVSGADYNARIIMQSDSSLAFLFDNNGAIRHRLYANGTKSGGTIEIDGKILGMSPIDSPQVLLETIEFDVPLTEQGTKVLLDSRFAKAVNYRFAVFPNNGRVIEKGANYFVIAGDGLADIRIVGERVGYAGVYFDDMTMEGVT